MLLPHHACVCYLDSTQFDVTSFPYINNTSDVVYRRITSFGIDDVSEVKQYAMRSPVIDEVVTLAISCHKMTVQAQNALLKILEDPPPKTQFIFFVTSKSVFIPTVHSRLHDVTELLRKRYLQKENTFDSNECTEYEIFLYCDYKDRLSMIDKAVKNEKVDVLVEFIMSHQSMFTLLDSNKKAVSFVLEHMFQPGASKKMLLEYLALQLQVVTK